MHAYMHLTKSAILTLSNVKVLLLQFCKLKRVNPTTPKLGDLTALGPPGLQMAENETYFVKEFDF